MKLNSFLFVFVTLAIFFCGGCSKVSYKTMQSKQTNQLINPWLFNQQNGNQQLNVFELLLNEPYPNSLKTVLSTLSSLGYTVNSFDSELGLISAQDQEAHGVVLKLYEQGRSTIVNVELSPLPKSRILELKDQFLQAILK